MIIEGSTMKMGGNKFKFWIGSKIQKWGSNIVGKNKHVTVTDPSCKLINTFTLIISFKVCV